MRCLRNAQYPLAALVVSWGLLGQAEVTDDSLLRNLSLRAIGPAVTGGRIDDVAVVEQRPSTIYIGAASGGVWKTTNNGTTWQPVFDDQSVSSIGDIAIAPSDPDIVWVGTGEPNNRQSSSFGDGVYRSSDGGRSWTHVGLRDSHHIGRIVIDPGDPNVVYVAAVGHLWGPNKERGLFKTADGGRTWAHVLFINEDTGVTDVATHPRNRQIVYAAAYQRRRTAWGFNGGGPHSGIHKSSDGGKTWTKLTGGLPTDTAGRIGLDVCRSSPDVVYAMVEHRTAGGVYRSGDAGHTWRRMNTLNNRPMYYSQVRCDPNNDQRIYSLGAPFYVSSDGGKTFIDPGTGQPGANRAMGSVFDVGVHSDFHGLWIDPNDSDHLILGGDGGLYFSYDGSISWNHVDNIPLGQFYAIGVDMRKPYYIYGGLQDNHSFGGPSATRYYSGIPSGSWYQLDSGDGMYQQVDPTDPFTVYTTPNGGGLKRFDARTGNLKSIRPTPPAGAAPYRFNWTPPLQISPHDPAKVLFGGNRVFISLDRGENWAASDDLTRQEDRNAFPIMGVLPSGEMLSRHDGVGAWGTITALAESPATAGLIWAGTDDGNLQMSRDGGKSWTNVTDRVIGLPGRSPVSCVEPSHAAPATAYAAFDRHQYDDFSPYIYRTTNFGQSWTLVSTGLPKVGWVNVVREHPNNPRVLFAGTETGAFVTIDGGARWLRLPLPTVAVDDLVIHPRDNDLIIGTHGRSLYVMDDITPISGLTDQVLTSDAHLFPMRAATVFYTWKQESYSAQGEFFGQNPPFGALISYYLRAPTVDATIIITDAQGNVMRTIEAGDDAGIGRVAWDLRVAPPEGVPPAERTIDHMTRGWQAVPARGPFVLPGTYTVTLNAAGRKLTMPLRVDWDSDVRLTDAERRSRFTFLVTLSGVLSDIHKAIRTAAALSSASAGSGDGSGLVSGAVADQIRAIQRTLDSGGGELVGFGMGGSLRAQAHALVRDMEGDGVFPGTLTGPTSSQKQRLERLAKDVQVVLAELTKLSAASPMGGAAHGGSMRQ